MKQSKLYGIFIALLTAVLILSGSIAVPILIRPFYYGHIEPMELEEGSGLSREEIITAYDEMMDYCLGRREFSVGVLSWSEEGKAHFEDVRNLFQLELWVLCTSAALLLLLVIGGKLRRIKAAGLLGHGPGFWAGACLGGAFLLIGGLASINFDRTFELFHGIFFPGKDNWLLDKATDPIIQILPESFFLHCGILIAGLILVSSLLLIVLDLLKRRVSVGVNRM